MSAVEDAVDVERDDARERVEVVSSVAGLAALRAGAVRAGLVHGVRE